MRRQPSGAASDHAEYNNVAGSGLPAREGLTRGIEHVQRARGKQETNSCMSFNRESKALPLGSSILCQDQNPGRMPILTEEEDTTSIMFGSRIGCDGGE